MTQIDYTSRDFDSIKADLINLINVRTGYNWNATDPNDLGNIMVEAFAYMGDIMSYYTDRVANEIAITTSAKTSTVLQLAELFGYTPSGPTPATVDVSITNNGTTAIDVPVGTQFMAPLIYGLYSEVFFEAAELTTQLQPGETVTISATEGKTVNTDRPDLIDPTYHKPIPISLGTTDGSLNQTFLIYDTNVIQGSLNVYVGQGAAFSPWTYVANIIEAGPTDHVFTTFLNDDSTTNVVFGDGVNGMIPSNNQLVGAIYKTSVGLSGNIVAGALTEVTFIPGNPDLSALSSLQISNTYAATGGAEADDLTQLKSKLKAAINTQFRGVTLNDFSNLALTVPLVGKANAVAGTWSSVSLYIQTQDDGTYTPGVVTTNGNPTPTGNWNDLALAVQASLEPNLIIGSSVTVLPPTYVPVYVTANITVDGAYKQSSVVIAIKKALLNADGFFAYSQNVFGRTIAQSQLVSAINNVPGVLFVTLSSLNTSNDNSVGTISLNPNQLPYITASNLVINPTGGHS